MTIIIILTFNLGQNIFGLGCFQLVLEKAETWSGWDLSTIHQIDQKLISMAQQAIESNRVWERIQLL